MEIISFQYCMIAAIQRLPYASERDESELKAEAKRLTQKGIDRIFGTNRAEVSQRMSNTISLMLTQFKIL